MKSISIRQPWAWLILHGGKDIENRDWPTQVRGTVLVHASKGMTRDEYEDAKDTYEYASGCSVRMPAFVELERGGIVGQVDIVGCATKSTSPWFFGKFGFILANAKPLPFRPYKGMLGFFEVPDAGEGA